MNPEVWKTFGPNVSILEYYAYCGTIIVQILINSKQDPIGYWLEVTVSYPKEMHKNPAMDMYPPLPHSKVIRYKDLSKTQKKLLIQKIGLKAAKKYKSKKLVASLLTKRKYKVI